MQAQFEATSQQKQLAEIGRAMMDYSENYGHEFGLGHLKDNGFRVLNDLSRVGSMLTRYGVSFGPKQKDFTEADMALIAKFMQNEIVV
jgi:hypothetical protein